MRPLRIITSTALFVLGVFFLTGYSACKNACEDVACLNGGACQKGSCVCPTGFTGSSCEKALCSDVQCKNGGTCKDGTCQCPSGYEGALCEKLVVERYIGTWTGTAEWGGGTTHDAAYVITKGITDYDMVIVEKVLSPGDMTLRGTITDSKSLKIPMQASTPSYTIEGVMVVKDGKLIFDRTITGTSGGSTTCKVTCIKQ